MKRTNLRPWSQGDDNGLCGLFATINAVRWLWPELRHKDDDGEERVAALALHLVRDRLNAAQFKALYLDGDELPLLSKLVDWAHEWLRADGKIAEISFPFSREPPADHKAYWTRLLPLIEPRSAIAIVASMIHTHTGPLRRTRAVHTAYGFLTLTCSGLLMFDGP